jgi:hypothetical protein
MPGARPVSARHGVLGICVLAVTVLGHGPSALAAWSPGAGGAGAARAHTMPAGGQPTASVSNRSVTVSWDESSFGGGQGVSGYEVRRYSTGGVVQAIGAGCSGTITGLSCVETDVPPGAWRYSVTPRQGAWSGAESAQSTAVVVAAPALSLSTTTPTSLPSTLTGSITGFRPGQSVSFRLDDPATGAPLAGSINPSPVPAAAARR